MQETAHEPSGQTDVGGTANAEALRFAERLVTQVRPWLEGGAKDTHAILDKVLTVVFGDPEIRLNFVGADIRHTAMCGEVARELLRMVGEAPELVGLLSIGDVELPDFARTTIDDLAESAHHFHQELSAQETYGYDLSSRGALRARQALIGHLDRHYGFSDVPNLCERLAENAAICAGGMRGLDDIATAHVRLAQPKKWPRFIHPDNSFGTWHAITQLRGVGGQVATVHTLTTKPENLLHLTADDVTEFYERDTTSADERASASGPTADLWCVTPVGNPSGTCMAETQLADVCRRIISHAPHATLLLDCTYVRTLPRLQARALIRGLLDAPAVLDRVIFLDSFSKTHGICGERVGAYFSANRGLFDEHHSVNMMLSAGNGRHKSAMVLALAHATPAQDETIESLHRFWQQERLGLYHYLIANGQFTELFDDKQSHLRPDQLACPLGMYLFVKLREGVSGKDVLMRTGCLGVETPMGSGRYVRFAVGKITTETYAHYLPTP